MKNRLQELWDKVTPDSGPCPQPDVKKVRRRVDKALDGRPRAMPRRVLRLAIVAAAAVLLLTSTALAGGELIPPEFNVLSGNFLRGENAANAIAMMTITPVSVSDDNYTMTVTSSLADGNELYFTVLIESKNDEARERLERTEFRDLLSYRIPGSSSHSSSGEIAPENGVWHIDVSASWRPGKSASVRLNTMDEGIWLEFPVKPVRSITLKVNAGGQGMGDTGHAAGGPVTLKTVEISPLSFHVDYTTPYSDQGVPVLYFLYKDGAIKSMGQLHSVHPSGHGGPDSLFGSSETYRGQSTYSFPSVQDLSLMEAVIFEGTAYPLDGSEPYEVDMTGFVQPFTVPVGNLLGDSADFSVPLFALCDGLGASYEWDEAAGTVSAAYRGRTLTFALDSKLVQRDVEGWEPWEMYAAPVYQDGELWVDASVLIRSAWDIELTSAIDSWETRQTAEDGLVSFTSWVVIP